MLSSENHPPADTHEISLKGVDLSNPSLDDHNPIPKFSIRDYVFNTRSKNIKANWPFSEKNLQLCLKHGVKDILPPFQCLDCIKNRSSKSDSVESRLSEKQKVINSDMDPPNQSVNKDISGFKSCNKQLSVIKNNSPAEVLPNTSGKSVSQLPKKTEISKPSSLKKCKLIVKVGPSSNSNIASSSMVEPVASSKLCPVCKKFSSSSNTKLNAHIDQCLSVESPVEPRTKSRVIKHKIKPKKTRLMVDIYATAPHCTIEELDRRNGRIWNEKTNLPTIEEDRVDCVDKEEKQKQSIGFDEKGDDDEGAVYIDAKGTKLRILNKISDTSSTSKLGLNPLGLRKPLKKGKESKLLSSYKKKQKHNKYSKLSSQREKVRSYKTRLASRVLDDQEEDKYVNETPKEDETIGIKNSAESSKSLELIVKAGSLIPKWASSKGTGLFKRRVESDESSLCESYIERSYSQKVRNWYEIPKKVKNIDNFSSEGPIDEYHEQQPFSKKQMGFKSVKSRSFTSVDRTFSSSREPMLSADHAPQLSKKCPFRVRNGHEYSEKNLEHQNRIDENAGQFPIKKSNVLKIKKKKQAAIITHRNESSQDLGNREPPRVDSRFEEGFADVEPPRRDEMVIGQSLGHDSGNVMSLGKSFDQDFYSIGDIEIGPTDVESNYFSGVDPITIPGPPGSFLPSPGRTSSEEDHHQGNSSLTNSQVQSSIDCLELVDRDSSNSPKSAHSTVSNSLLARSDLKSTENMCLEPRVPEDEIIKLGFSDVITKSTLGFQDNQPCCCSRKEGTSVNNQEYSHLLKRRVMSSSPAPTADKQSSSYQNITVSPPVYGDFGSLSPSSPNPILRLMGKDLVVVNSDENINHSPSSKLQAGPSDDHHVHQVSPNYGYRRIDMDLHEYKPSFAGLNRSLNSPFSPLGYNKTERVETYQDTIQKNNRKDVIVIDDAPENEAHTDNLNVIQASSGGFPIPLAGYYSSRHLNPFSSYQGPDLSTYRSPHMIPNISSPVSPSSLGPMRWNNSILEGSRVPPSGSLTPSPSTKRAKSSLYYSPSMS